MDVLENLLVELFMDTRGEFEGDWGYFGVVVDCERVCGFMQASDGVSCHWRPVFVNPSSEG